MTDLTFHKPARRRVRRLIRAIVWLTTLAWLRHRFTMAQADDPSHVTTFAAPPTARRGRL